MALPDIEKKKQGLQSYQDFPVPAPQAAANKGLGDAATGLRSIPGKIKSGFNQAAEYLANKGNAAINKSANTVRAGERLTKAAPIFGSTTPGKDIVKGLGDLHGKAIDTTLKIQPAAYVGKGMMAAKDRVMSDYNKNEVRTGRATPKPKKKKTPGTAQAATATPKNASQAAQGTPNTRIVQDKPKLRGQLTMKNDGIYAGDRKATAAEIAAFQKRDQAKRGKAKTPKGQGRIHQVGNMNVQFDPNMVTPEQQAAFMRNPTQGTRMRSNVAKPAFDGGPRVSGPNPYGANQEQGPKYVTRETHPNITGEAATAINRAIQAGHEQRQNTNLTNQGSLDQIGAQGQNQLANTGLQGQNQMGVAKQYGMNSVSAAQAQAQGQMGIQGVMGQNRLAQEKMAGQNDMALEQYKQANEDKFDYVPPQHDKKGNQLPGTGLFIPKDPYNLSKDFDPKNIDMESFAKIDFLINNEYYGALDAMLAPYGMSSQDFQNQ